MESSVLNQCDNLMSNKFFEKAITINAKSHFSQGKFQLVKIKLFQIVFFYEHCTSTTR